MAPGASVRMGLGLSGWNRDFIAGSFDREQSIDAEYHHAAVIALAPVDADIIGEAAIRLIPAEQVATRAMQHNVFDMHTSQLAPLCDEISGHQPVCQGDAHFARRLAGDDGMAMAGR